MSAFLYKKVVGFGIRCGDSDAIKREVKMLNSIAFIGSWVYLVFGLTFLFSKQYIHAYVNFSIVLVNFGSYYLFSFFKKPQLSKWSIFYFLPIFAFLPVYYLYGNNGGEFYTFFLVLMYVFIDDNKRRTYFYVGFSTLFIACSRLIILHHAVDPEWALIAQQCYTPNVIFSFLLSAGFTLFFKKEILNKHEKILQISEQLQQKYLEEKHRKNQIEQLSNELNHRVKNNLQIISSLINLQMAKLSNNECGAYLSDVNNKIRSLSLVHQKLHKTESGYIIILQEYVEELFNHIFQSFGDVDNLGYEMVIAHITLSIEDAVSIGLILNELITNAVKYGKNNGVLSVKLHVYKVDRILHFRFSDNGKGLSEYALKNENESFGLGFIRKMIESYSGTMTILNDQGASFDITLTV